VRAIQAGNDLERVCPRLTCASAPALTQGRQLNARGETAALIANVTLPVGALLASIGGYLLARDSGSRREPTALSPRVSEFEVSAHANQGSVGAVIGKSW
jgi:hypothetical protein